MSLPSTLKRLNHLGSAGLLAAAVLLLAVMLLPALGITVDWKPKTTPYRLVTQPFIGGSLVIFLGLGLVLIRRGTPLMQCVSALIFVGAVFGVAITSALFWDAWLAPMLVSVSMPVQFKAALTLRALVHPEQPKP